MCVLAALEKIVGWGPEPIPISGLAALDPGIGAACFDEGPGSIPGVGKHIFLPLETISIGWGACGGRWILFCTRRTDQAVAETSEWTHPTTCYHLPIKTKANTCVIVT